ncbi:MAG TPA: BTAD domain-containing putative transcriptional regulator [Streptosporangiaceae bacterium]|nr:BTAD domain-containing putative transcriptional regulator [Streptosporangiaceae bacterium]
MVGGIILRVLGPVEVCQEGGPVQPSTPQQRLVLGMLALRAGHVVPVDDLSDALWDGEPPPSVRNTVQALITRLRKVLAAQPEMRLTRYGDGYRLDAPADVVDAHEFRRLTGLARRAPDPLSAVATFDEALGLWRGPALADVAETPRAERLRTGLAAEWLSAMQERAGALMRCSRYPEAADQLDELFAAHPLRESVAGLLMEALYGCGRQADALAVFRDTRERLVEELGVEPGPELQQLHERILNGDPSLSTQEKAASGGRSAAPDPAGVQSAARLAVPRQLPAAARHFAGRQAELRSLDSLLDTLGGPAGALVVGVIDGMAGVGKTTMAVQWAHQAADRFPDGQLYVDMRGFSPSGQPATWHQTMRRFLDAFGVPAERVPADPDAQAGLYRSLLADKRVLIVLDNARDEQQVRPLLPSGPGCLVLITSRNKLTGLVTAECAQPVTLHPLTESDARDLLGHRLRERVTAEPAGAAELITLCSRLPLALSVAAARAATRPSLALRDLCAELREADSRRHALDTADPATSVWAAFSWSYRQLSRPVARMFRLLGLHPGPDVSVPAAASLAGVSIADARHALDELARAHLATEDVTGRFSVHDLLRVYANELAVTSDNEASRARAVHRLLDYYLHTGHAAVMLLSPGDEPLKLAGPKPGAVAEQMSDNVAALAWLDSEHRVLAGLADQATAAGLDTHAWQIAWLLAAFFHRRGSRPDLVTALDNTMRAAVRANDGDGLGRTHRALGYSLALSGSVDAGLVHMERSLALFRELGDLAGQACTELAMIRAFESRGQYREALNHAQQALELYEQVGDRKGQARALNAVGREYGLLGDQQQAWTFGMQAVKLFRDTGDRYGQGMAWDSLGDTNQRLGDHDRAVMSYQQALSRHREIGDRYSEAFTLNRLAVACRAAANPLAARGAWQEALAILDDLHHPDAEQIRANLAELDRHDRDVSALITAPAWGQ